MYKSPSSNKISIKRSVSGALGSVKLLRQKAALARGHHDFEITFCVSFARREIVKLFKNQYLKTVLGTVSSLMLYKSNSSVEEVIPSQMRAASNSAS